MTLPIPTTPVSGSQVSSTTFGIPVATDLQALAAVPLSYYDRKTLAAPAASLTFTVPSNLRSVRILHTARNDAAGGPLAGVGMRINGDSTSSYNFHVLSGQGSGAPGSAPFNAQNYGAIGICAGGAASAGVFGAGVVEIVGWDNPHTGVLAWTWTSGALGATTGFYETHEGHGHYFGTFAARTSITIIADSGTNFVVGSDFQLSGVYA